MKLTVIKLYSTTWWIYDASLLKKSHKKKNPQPTHTTLETKV